MSANYDKAQQEAEKIIATYGIKEPVVPIFDIAKNFGLQVKFIKMPKNLDNVAGFLDKEGKIIYVNNDDVPNRQTFTVAHELGHYVLEHTPDEYKVLLRLPGIATNDVEKEANCFAANILVPETILDKIMKQYSLGKDAYVELSRIFGVSSEMMKNRLNRVH